jgi:hypothetical protein
LERLLQTTLLSLAIALILALVAALVGPFFVDWNQYRSTFETEASRLIGMQVRVRGGIEVRMLPVPSVVLNDIKVGHAGAEPRLQAQKLRFVLALGPLMKGEVRAVDMRLVEPEFAVGLDSTGRLDWPAMAMGLDPDSLSIERLVVENGRVTLGDAVSGSKVVLEKLDFSGEMRSLLGPFKGEGAFVVDGYHQPFRLSTGRVTDGTFRVRLITEPLDRPLMADADGMLSWERGEPRFDGTLTLTRRAATARPDGNAMVIEPWRATSKVKLTSAAALFEQVEFQYGPEERAVKLTGAANLRFGSRPLFEGALSARQIDFDRLAGTADATKRSPATVAKAFAETFGVMRPIVPVALALSVDQLTLAGANLYSVGADLRTDGNMWNLERLDFRGPGVSQVNLSGRVEMTPTGAGFTGAVKVEASDPKTLVAWLDGRAITAPGQIKPFFLRGDVTLSTHQISIERLRTELDRESAQGRLLYAWSDGARPARMDAVLNAPELDLDALLAFGNAALAGTTFERPREISLALELGRARLAGMEARNAAGRLRWDSAGLQIERWSVGDFGGAALVAQGHIDTSTNAPRGNLTVDLDARSLGGLAALGAKFAPESTDLMQRIAARLPHTKLQANLQLGDAPAAGAAPRTAAKLELKGRAGAIRVNLTAAATGFPGAFTTDLRDLRATELRLDGKLDADDGSVLASVLGLDPLVSVDKRPAQVTFTGSGPAGGDLRFASRVAAGGLDVNGQGSVRPFGDAPITAAFDLNVAGANIAPMQQKLGVPQAQPLPLTLKTRLSVTGPTITLPDFVGTLAGTTVKGQLALGLGTPLQVDGRIDSDAIDGSLMLSGLLGLPLPSTKPESGWSAEPFGPTVDLLGQLDFTARRASFAPSYTLRQVRGTLRFGRSELELTEIESEIGGGRLSGQVLVRSGGASGLSARSTLRLTSADLAALLPHVGRDALSGRVALQLDAEGAGLSPAAFIGSVTGNGTLVLEDLQIANLDTRAFDNVIRAIDQGLALDQGRVQNTVGAALDKGRLNIPWAEGTFAIASGQVRLGTILAPAQGADVNLSGRYELGPSAVNLRLALSGPPKPPTPERPEIVVAYRGPLAAPQRSVDASMLVTWLALRAVEQQAKQLEELENKRREAVAAAAIEPPPVAARSSAEAAATTPTQAAPPSTPDSTPAAANRPAQASAGVNSEQAKPAASGEAGDAAALQQAPALPPPVVVRPTPRAPRQVETAPGTPQVLPRPRPPQRPGATPPSAAIVTPNAPPAPPAPAAESRSFFDRLFNPQQLLQQN